MAVLPSTGRDPSHGPDPAPWHARRQRRWRHGLPPLVSAALVGWLVWRVSPQVLLEAAAGQHLVVLVPATLVLVAVLYLWDALCLRWLFAQPNRSVPYVTALRARGTSYLVGILNYEFGQGLLAWLLAHRLGMGLLPAVGRCLVLAVHDVAVLLTFGLVGSVCSSDARAAALGPLCAAGLAALVVGLMLFRVLPGRWQTRFDAGLGDWRWPRSAQLYGLRVIYFSFLVAYAAGGLSLCDVAVNRGLVLGVISLVLLADGLPISVSGLGTRETALLYLLQPEHPEIILAWSLLWSTGLLVGRAAIGLANVWLGPLPVENKEDLQ